MASTTDPSPTNRYEDAEEAREAERTALRYAFAEVLNDVAYTRGRVWEAWQYNTMTEDDFTPAWEDEELLTSLVDAALAQSPADALTAVKAEASTTGGGRLSLEFAAKLREIAAQRIEDVWADVGATDAQTLASNVVAAQEWLWLSLQFPISTTPTEGATT